MGKKKNRETARAGSERQAALPLWIGVAAAAVSAALFAITAPGMPFPWLVWVALVPFFFALRHTADFWKGALLGLTYGWGMWFFNVWWLMWPLRDLLGLPGSSAFLVTVAGCLVLGFPYLIAGGVLTKWMPARGIAGSVYAAAVLTLTTTWLSLVFEGNIAHSQYRYPAAIQIAELGGVPLLLFAIYWVNWMAADAVSLFNEQRRKAYQLAGCSAGAICLIFAYGGIRLAQFGAEMRTAGPERWIAVGAVQPNLPIRVHEERQPAPEALENNFLTAMTQARDLAQAHPELDLIVLPENPDYFNFNEDGRRRALLGQTIREAGVPFILNVDGLGDEDPPSRYNIAIHVNANQNLAGAYVKMKRLPLVEYLPWEERLPWLRALFPNSLRVIEGAGPIVFPIGGDVHVIPLICYEGTLASFTRQFVREDGNLIVNQTNDSWFLRTRASEIHFALALFRTVENRVPMVRVTNSGTSAHIQADGRIVPGSKTGLFVEATTAFPLYLPPNRPLYTSTGNWWTIGLVLYMAGYLVRRHRRTPGGGGRKC